MKVVKVGDDILVKGKITDIEDHLYRYSIKVEVIGFLEGDETHNLIPCTRPVIFWIERPKANK